MNMVPMLEASPEVSLLINDTILPEYGTAPRFIEISMRHTDLAMMTIANAKQRFLRDWCK
jgi:hypothetical protein